MHYGVGRVSSGNSINYVVFSGGSIKSEPGFSPALDATLEHGQDVIRVDPSGKHMRLDVRSMMKNSDGAVGRILLYAIPKLKSWANLGKRANVKRGSYSHITTRVSSKLHLAWLKCSQAKTLRRPSLAKPVSEHLQLNSSKT